MGRFQVFDAPIGNPDNDLLGMVAYAKKLARFVDSVEPPFTIGVYGEWGEGKTSFVQLLEHFLTESDDTGQVKFITFSAWPHTTSDALWRALIIRIAKELYEVPNTDTETAATTSPGEAAKAGGLFPILSNFLTADAFVLRKLPPAPDPLAEYKDLIARLDRTAYGSISKNTAQHLQINQEVAFMAIVKAAMAALGSVSPLVAGIRSLLGIEPQVNLAEMLHTEKNVATRDIIESVQEFKQVFREMFETKASGKRVFVFVDDLDRCLPDVALDILEAIKIFLDEVGCIFIVAADENLIGQGLRLRYKDLLERHDREQAQTFFAQKGQEYFEKIIQFGVRVPPRTPGQAHTFISAQFPTWVPATDIIQTAIGHNPRRLKQYCNLLSYKHTVADMQALSGVNGQQLGMGMDQPQLQLLDKVITVHAWAPHCLETLGRLASTPEEYVTTMSELESWLGRSAEDAPLPEAGAALPNDECRELYLAIVSSAPLFRLFQSEPLFSQASPTHVTTFAQFADIEPHPDTILHTQDTIFMRILEAVSQQGSISIKKLMLDDLAKLITLDVEHPTMAGHVHDMAQTPQWTAQLLAIEAVLDQSSNGTEPEAAAFDEAATYIRHLLQGTEDAEEPSTASRKLFLTYPRFSTMPREEVQLYWGIREKLPAAETLLTKELFDSSSLAEKSRRIAVEAVNLLPLQGRQAIELGLNLRLEAAQYFLELRSFAKLDALAYKWPALARQLRLDGSRFLKVLERQVIDPQASPEEVPAAWQQFLQDEQLVRFLGLRPLFGVIDQPEVKEYFAASQVVAKAPAAPEPVAAPVGPELAQVSFEEPPFAYQNLFVRINQIEGEADTYEVALEAISGKAGAHIQIPLSLIQPAQASLVDAFQYRPVTRELAPAPPRATDPMTHIRDLGSQVYDLIFKKGEVQKLFLQALQGDQRIRIVLEMKEPQLTLLPWECLYVPPLRAFPALMQKYSLLRYLPGAISLIPRTLTPPLRILAVLTNPRDAPPLDTDQERATLERALAAGVQSGQVELEILDHATLSMLQRALRRFQPHLFHFVGHGTYLPDVAQGALLFEDEDGLTRMVQAADLKTLLVDSNINLAVLNACDTGTTGINDIITGVAGALVQDGIPAAIATMRAVVDRAALMFSREFYRAFVDGYTLEAAIIEARKALSVEKWDWPAYALFGATTELDAFRLLPQQRGQEER